MIHAALRLRARVRPSAAPLYPLLRLQVRGSSSSSSSSSSSGPGSPAALVDPHAARRSDLPARDLTLQDVSVRYARSGGPGGQSVNKLVSPSQTPSRRPG